MTADPRSCANRDGDHFFILPLEHLFCKSIKDTKKVTFFVQILK